MNLSLGGGGYTETLKTAVSYAAERDVLLLAAAGNSGTRAVDYPAAYDEVVAVSALAPDESLAFFSNYGAEIEVAAPGLNVLSTYPDDEYRALSGTSMATPVAAGVAALGKAEHLDLSRSQLRTLLTGTAVDVGLDSDEQGAGRVDAAEIVSRDPDAVEEDTDDPSCAETARERYDGYLFFGADTYTYHSRFDTCSVTADLDGPTFGSFDLYVTADGRTPTTDDYDAHASGDNSLFLDGIAGEMGVLVDAGWSTGFYTITVEEVGD